MDIDLQPQVKLKESLSVLLGWAFFSLLNKQEIVCKFFVATVKLNLTILHKLYLFNSRIYGD